MGNKFQKYINRVLTMSFLGLSTDQRNLQTSIFAMQHHGSHAQAGFEKFGRPKDKQPETVAQNGSIWYLQRAEGTRENGLNGRSFLGRVDSIHRSRLWEIEGVPPIFETRMRAKMPVVVSGVWF